ncbi:hypothetical protein EYF80_049773 [Liparis tanakae]|uniref:Uncharacterized protein n=1 Tax=Liparis tanakae TaxID=230148 RepID=A0A4Z2FFU9_9TELE|nr:hypothetical protein EYF80_049773 [Liparis tanakae]
MGKGNVEIKGGTEPLSPPRGEGAERKCIILFITITIFIVSKPPGDLKLERVLDTQKRMWMHRVAQSHPRGPKTSVRPEAVNVGPEVVHLGPEVVHLGPEVVNVGPEVVHVGPKSSTWPQVFCKARCRQRGPNCEQTL